jgi:hypothetical protein
MARVKPSQLDGGGLRALQPKPTGDLGKTESPVDGSGSHRLCGELKEAKRVKPSRNRESNQEVGFTNQFTRGGLGKTEPPSPNPETGSQSFTRQSKRGRHGQTESPSFFLPCTRTGAIRETHLYELAHRLPEHPGVQIHVALAGRRTHQRHIVERRQ